MPLASSIGNLSNFVSSQLYPTQQGPRYIQGNATSAGLVVVAAGLYAVIWGLLRRRNLKKKKATSEGAAENGMEGDRALGLVYVLRELAGRGWRSGSRRTVLGQGGPSCLWFSDAGLWSGL